MEESFDNHLCITRKVVLFCLFVLSLICSVKKLLLSNPPVLVLSLIPVNISETLQELQKQLFHLMVFSAFPVILNVFLKCSRHFWCCFGTNYNSLFFFSVFLMNSFTE